MNRIVSFSCRVLSCISFLLAAPSSRITLAQEVSVEEPVVISTNTQQDFEKIRVLVRVGEYFPDGLTHDFVDGSVTSDLSKFRILEPQEYKGDQITVQHPTSPPDDSPWKSEGQLMWLDLQKRVLDDQQNVYSTFELEIVELIEP